MANEPMRDHWTNVTGPHWVRDHRTYDRMLEQLSAALVAAITAGADDRVLDVGCGTGTLTAAVAERVGSVVGVDISAVMVEGARERFDDVPNVEFVVADAQHDALPGQFDAVVSRFGVMFFDDPVAAFANIGAAARRGASLTFVCWRGIAENLVFSAGAHALIAALPEPPAVADPLAPGPMAFADPARLRGILIDGGWMAIDIEPLDRVARFGLDGSDGIEERLAQLRVGESGRRLTEQVPDADQPAAWKAARAELEEHLVDGELTLPAAAWLVHARR